MELRGKQKRYLRAMAHDLKPKFQIGKDGVNNNMVEAILEYLELHELVKVNMLQNCEMEKDDVSTVFENEEIDVVQVIGNTFVLYKESHSNKEINLPR